MATVILAEKPSVARDIARILKANHRNDGFMEGNGYVVTWAIGHLVHFAEPDDYGPHWKGRWSFGQLPMIPEHWMLKTHESTAKQFQIVKSLLNNPATTDLVCATDAGREGENIFRLIYEHAGCNKPWKRLWISSLTDDAIEAGFRNLHPGSAFDDLGRAARARAQADWLVGMNLTRAYTVHHGALYTIGRVQTPTLAMVVRREELITNFTKAFFYELVAQLNEGFQVKYTDSEGKTRIDEKPLAERLHRELKDHKTGTVSEIKKKTKKVRPPQLYDLITLQKDANKRFGLTAAEVLKHAQTLYETYKVISYPRTESRHIGEDMVPELPGILKALDHPQAPLALSRLQAGHKLSKNYVDRTRLSDHHGILPTNRKPPPNLSGHLRNIYDLIATRFVCIFLPDHVLEETRVSVLIGGQLFTAVGNVVQDPGWKIADPPRKKDSSQTIPPLKKGEIVHVNSLDLLEKETEPPQRYTDATLLTAMKNAGREVVDDQLAAAMKESGLGTPATRAEMIEKLIRTRYIERQKKFLVPTDKGKALISVVAGPLESPETTGYWEKNLGEIERGEYSADEFYHHILGFLREMVPQVRQAQKLQWVDPERQIKTPDSTPVQGEPIQGSARPAAKTAKKSKSSDKADPRNLAPCPVCGEGTIIQGNRAYGCTRYRLGCRFLINLEVQGKKLTLSQVRDLLTNGKTRVIKGFVGQDGIKFDAVLMLDEQKRVSFDRSTTGESSSKNSATGEMACPRCGSGKIIEGKRGFGCNRFKQGCDFVVWKEVSSKKLTKKQVRDLITKGKTEKISGFQSKDGRKFDASLVLGDGGRIVFDFG